MRWFRSNHDDYHEAVLTSIKWLAVSSRCFWDQDLKWTTSTIPLPWKHFYGQICSAKSYFLQQNLQRQLTKAVSFCFWWNFLRNNDWRVWRRTYRILAEKLIKIWRWCKIRKHDWNNCRSITIELFNSF